MKNDNMMPLKHDTKIDYPGGIEQLATDLGNLRYDALGDFLQKLYEKVKKDSQTDEGKERHHLAKQLKYSAKHIKNAWKICEPFMT